MRPATNRVFDIGSLTSLELTQRMGAGWNLGNTLDAHWGRQPWLDINEPWQQETMWGNPVTTKEMIDFVRASGFNTVRIPVTWYIFTGPGPDYIIDEAWMNRVNEVVDYVIDNGMFCILNMHHEDYRSGPGWQIGWLRPFFRNNRTSRPLNSREKANMNHRMERIWEQIAERFQDYDERLIFEGMNEPHTYGLSNISVDMWAEISATLNDLNQTFINTVRNSGGNNFNRHLMITPYFANVGLDPYDGYGRIRGFVDKENRKLRVNDPRAAVGQDTRLIASLHNYEPWVFVTAPDSSPHFRPRFDMSIPGVYNNVNNVFAIISENFVNLGIPVIMSETGAIIRHFEDGTDNNNERIMWVTHYVGTLNNMGVPVIMWDNGHEHRILDRRNVRWYFPAYTAAILAAASNIGSGSTTANAATNTIILYIGHNIPANIIVDYGTPSYEIGLPDTVVLSASNEIDITVGIEWDFTGYNRYWPATYNITGVLKSIPSSWIGIPDTITIQVHVQP